MSRNYLSKHNTNERRKSTSILPFLIERDNEERRRNSVVIQTRRLSTISHLFLPHGNEFHQQEHVPPVGPESLQPILIEIVEGESLPRKLSFEIPIHKRFNRDKQILFVIEPIFSAFILFPILALFWTCGWNLIFICLNILNQFPRNYRVDQQITENSGFYSSKTLIIPYCIVEFLLLCFYLFQSKIYEILKKQRWFVQVILLKFHIFILSTLYLIQLGTLWNIWDQFTPRQAHFEITLTVGSIFALIVFMGHLSNLVIAPFVFSYDSIEYCVYFGSPLLTRNMKQWKIYLINFVLYEIIVSNLSIIIWRGTIHILDIYLYPSDLLLSCIVCLIVGYSLYFPLMYFQTYLEELNVKHDFWTFISVNFPQLYRNIRHLLAFISCVFVWRGFLLLYGKYVYLYEDYYKTYFILYIVTYLFLCSIQSASSAIGPLSHIPNENNFFPLYPHCYLSIIYGKLSKFFSFKLQRSELNTKL